MAKKIDITYEQLMAMDETTLDKFCETNGIYADYAAICEREEPHKVYPKVLKPMKKPTPAQVKKHPELLAAYEKGKAEGKMTYQRDKTQTPKIVYKPISFFSVKQAIAFEVLKLKKADTAEKGETFRERVARKAQNL